MAEKKGSWWVRMGHFLDRIWAILQHAIFNYVQGDNNKIINVTGEEITFDGPRITITFEHPIFLNNKGLKQLHKKLEKVVNKEAWLSAYFSNKKFAKVQEKYHKTRKEVNHAYHLLDDDGPDSGGGMSDDGRD